MKNQYVLEEQNGIHNLYNITIQKVWDSVLNYYTYGKKEERKCDLYSRGKAINEDQPEDDSDVEISG